MKLRSRGKRPAPVDPLVLVRAFHAERGFEEDVLPSKVRQRTHGCLPEVKEAVRQVWKVHDKLRLNEKIWKTGPLLAAAGVDKEIFITIAEGACFNARLEYRDGNVYVVGDGSYLHEAAVYWFHDMINQQLRRYFSSTMTGGSRRIIAHGGRVEFSKRERQVDSAVFERTGSGTFDEAHTVLLVEVSNRNESLESLVDFFDEATHSSSPSNTKLALGLYFEGRTASDLSFKVLVKMRGGAMEVLQMSLTTGEAKVSINMRDLFSDPEVLALLPEGESPQLVLDFSDFRSYIIPVLGELTPAQIRRLKRI